MQPDFQTNAVFQFAVVGILTMLGLSLVVVWFAGRAQKKMLEQRMNAQARELRHQQELLERNLLIQEEERQRIAAQLHDDIGSKLGVMHLTFHRLRRMDAKNAEIEPLLDEINDLISTTLQATRRISHELLPPTLEDFGLLEALDEFFEGVRNTGVVDVFFDKGQTTRADFRDPMTELNLFRIVQELTSNTLKYAEASRIDLVLNKKDEKMRLEYRDDGCGFDFEKAKPKGLGLKNLKNRARMIGGELEIESAIGKGFLAKIEF